MTNHIFIGETEHTRSHPIDHYFKYPLYVMSIELKKDEPLRLGPLFSSNSFNMFSLYDRDYLIETSDNIYCKVEALLDRFSISIQFDELYLVTTPRFFKKTFNPVNFYYLYFKGILVLILAEVTNTFKEKHLYFLDPMTSEKKNGLWSFTSSKNFYISPFSEDDGELEFYVSDIKESLTIVIHYYYQNRREITATLRGDPRVLTTKNLLSLGLKFPLSAAKTMPRILYQAAQIHFIKKHKARRKPMATEDLTIKKERSTFIKRNVLSKFDITFSKIQGDLRICYPNGDIKRYGQESDSPIELYIYTYDYFDHIIRAGDIGLGESYMQGQWKTSDLPGLLSLFIHNLELLDENYSGKAIIQGVYKLKHKFRKNSLKNSRRNIADHYDLGNEFYSLFLDPTMSYSCGYFETPQTTLEEAQKAKIAKVIDKLQLQSHHHVLEIGSGWGSQAIAMAQETGCKVTSLTLSKEQHRYAVERVQLLNLEDQVDIKLEDYRTHQGRYDRLVSIEMIEAVGHDYLPTYLSCCDSFLKADGIAVIQAITMSDQYYEDYVGKTDFIQQYIFPGAHLPSLSHLNSLLSKHTQLMIDQSENMGQHYAVTLRKWREQFLFHEKAIVDMYDTSFFRMWELYFAYCEAGFRQRYIHDVQLVLTKPKNTFLIDQFDKEFYV